MLKRFLFLSSLAVFVLLCTIQVGVTSCTKTDTIVDTVIKTKTDTLIQIKRDTLQEKDTNLTAAILTANSWKILEDRALVGSNYVYYLRGGTSNTQNFDNEYITFSANNTATYTDNNGGQSSFTWNFTDASNKKLVWLWNLPQPVTVTWENIVYDDGAIRYTEYYTQFGVNTLSSEVRIPK
ncbi:MAG TPA: hypothetical protein VFP87_03650 [Chitinophagaceae bacterium]|nr:hypothetical protein [Chitinophagaceae bacterium]